MPSDNTKLTGPSMEERIAARLRNSGEGANPHVHVKTGEGATRTHTNIHYSPNLDRGGREGEG
jgi:hypothetical protein